MGNPHARCPALAFTPCRYRCRNQCREWLNRVRSVAGPALTRYMLARRGTFVAHRPPDKERPCAA